MPDIQLDPILTQAEVLRVVPFSRMAIFRMVQSGDFPAPMRLSHRKLGWKQSWIADWLDSRPRVYHDGGEA